ncbi:hypothetical protein Tco_0816214, partial [Tanacetum coccineum]
SYNDLKLGGGFERAFVALFDQDVQTFTGSTLLNLDQLEKQLDKEEFQETRSMDAFRVLKTHKTKSDQQDTSSKSGNDANIKDADIRPVNDQVPFAELGSLFVVFAKPHHVIAPGSSRNSSKESYGSNDMAHNYYLEEAKKKTQDKNRNLKPREMPSARTHHSPNTCTPKPRSNNQTSRNWPASKSSEETLKAVQKADHSRNPSSFSDSKHFVCSTCQKCVFNANHDACITKFLKEVNSRVKVQSPKTRNSNKPVEPKIHTQKPGKQIVTGHRFSPNKSSAVHEKTNTPRSCLRWIPTGRIFNTVGLRWVPTGKIFTSSTTKVDCEPPNGSNENITNPYKCDQTLNVRAVAPKPAASTGSPSSTTVDQDAPSASNSQTSPETQSLVISNDVEEDNHDLDVAHMNNDPLFGILIP